MDTIQRVATAGVAAATAATRGVRNRYNKSGKDLIVLFSHSARIRCFMRMMYPYVSGSGNYSTQSIYDILADKKFFNSVSFKLVKKSETVFLLTMIHEGHIVHDEKRLNKQQFYDKIKEITREDVREGDGINVYIKTYQESDTATAYTLDTGFGLNVLLSDNKDIIIIRHGQSTHNKAKLRGLWHFTRDTSLTKEGIQETVGVSRDLVYNTSHFNNYDNVVFYVSELWRTQQTAMIFVNILSREDSPPNGVKSTSKKPVRLNVVPCNHEFDEAKIKEDWCFQTIEKTSQSYKRENKRTSKRRRFTSLFTGFNRIDNRRNVMFSIDNYRLMGGGPRAPKSIANEPIAAAHYSYFFVDDSEYDENTTCRKSVFHYIKETIINALINIDNIWLDYQIPQYTDFEEASRYDYTYDHYTDGIVGTIQSGSNYFRKGGSLKKKKKRKTLRRKSKRFTKKRNSRRTTKKRLTNKRRTNKKKRFTKRR